MERKPQGVYFLANDRTIDLAICFLNSFRQSNPTFELCLIPYDQRSEQVIALAERYNFQVFSDEKVLAFCDTLERRVLDRRSGRAGCFRKCAAWAGPFERFLYIDIDTVVLKPVNFVFSLLNEFDFIGSHSSPRAVWQPSIQETGLLTKEQIAFSVSSGFLASHRGALSIEEIEAGVPKAHAIHSHMHPRRTDQPFLNFMIVQSGKRYTTLHRLHYGGRRSIPLEFWAGKKGAKVSGGQLTMPGDPTPILLVHWAGVYHPRQWQYRLRAWLQRRGFFRGKEPLFNIILPYKKLWTHYRLLRGTT